MLWQFSEAAVPSLMDCRQHLLASDTEGTCSFAGSQKIALGLAGPSFDAGACQHSQHHVDEAGMPGGSQDGIDAILDHACYAAWTCLGRV